MKSENIKIILLKGYRLFYACCRFVGVTILGEEFMKKNEDIKSKVYGKLLKRKNK
jgi:hypothetical protein